MNIFNIFKKKNKVVKRKKIVDAEYTRKVERDDSDCVVRTEKFVPHFVYSHAKNQIIGTIYLTEDQAYNLNKLMVCGGNEKRDIVFLRS